MKQYNKFHFILSGTALFFCLYFIVSCSTTKQPVEVTGASDTEMAQAITSGKWVFIANQAMPQSGRSRMLTTRYSVILNNDTLTSALPYFGRAYAAPIGETTSPLDFSSTNFTLSKNESGAGRWNVNIKTNDVREVQVYNFTLFTNGSAQLSVQLTNRSPISFSGRVMPVK
ncbi:MAG: DUF4251 domain-containing protein [Agriterribacter sp.]